MEQTPFAPSSCPTDQNGKWYFITFGWSEMTYYDNRESLSSTTELVFIPPGGSIAKHILLRYRQFRENGEIYSREQRGLEDADWRYASIVELALLLPTGQKIVGFKPKSIAHLFFQGGMDEWEQLIARQSWY